MQQLISRIYFNRLLEGHGFILFMIVLQPYSTLSDLFMGQKQMFFATLTYSGFMYAPFNRQFCTALFGDLVQRKQIQINILSYALYN